MTELVKNTYGFLEVAHKPTAAELSDFYAKKYFQQSPHQYSAQYTDEEKQFFINREREIEFIVSEKLGRQKGRFLDLGCGEGWALSYFHSRGWSVRGIDFSEFAVRNHNPAMLPYFQSGNLFELIDAERESYDFISLKNVLEHVIDPVGLVVSLRKRLAPGGVVLIMVPNDFSDLQKHLLQKGHIDREFWVTPPDHLSYFSQESLKNLMTAHGFEAAEETSEYPIDLNLLTDHTNYVRTPSLGKGCYQQKIRIDNYLSEVSIAKKVALYKAYAELGLGRNLMSYFTLK